MEDARIGGPSPPATCRTFADFVVQHERLVLGVCLRYLRDEDAARDACQETFFAAWRHMGNELPDGPARAWLTRIAVNKSIDELRRRTRRGRSLEAYIEAGYSEPEAHTPSGEQVLLNGELEAALGAALKELPSDQCVSIVLRDLQDLSYPEIARLSDVPIGTVKSRLSRARANLRSILLR